MTDPWMVLYPGYASDRPATAGQLVEYWDVGAVTLLQLAQDADRDGVSDQEVYDALRALFERS